MGASSWSWLLQGVYIGSENIIVFKESVKQHSQKMTLGRTVVGILLQMSAASSEAAVLPVVKTRTRAWMESYTQLQNACVLQQ